MKWPAQSPDLNCNRKPLGGREKKVSKAKPNNNEELWGVVKDSWSKIPQKRCQDLDSMPRRCAAVIANSSSDIIHLLNSFFYLVLANYYSAIFVTAQI